MSTKTTFKRVALVAVAALGFGVLTSVAPASAADNVNITAITAGTSSPARTQVSSGGTTISVVHPAGSTSETVTAQITSAPATSVNAVLTFADASTNAPASSVHTASSKTDQLAASNAGVAMSVFTVQGSSKLTTSLSLKLNADVAGTYQILVTANAASAAGYSTGKITTSYSITTAGTPTTITAASYAGSVTTSGRYGQLMYFSLKDAAGTATVLGLNESIDLTDDSAAVTQLGGTTSAGSAVTSFGSASSNSSGKYYFRVVNTGTAIAADGTAVITMTGSGLLPATLTTNASATLKKAVAATTGSTITAALATAAYGTDTNGAAWSSGTIYTTGAQSVKFSVLTNDSTAAAVVMATELSDAAGYVYNSTATKALSTTATTTVSATAPAVTSTGANTTIKLLQALDGTTGTTGVAATLAYKAAAASAIAVSGSSSVLSATGGSTAWAVQATDQYGTGIAYAPVTVAVAGRNTVLTTAIGVTDANGFISYTLKDAGTTGTKDTLTFTSGSLTAVTATVTYGTVTVAKVSFTGGSTTASVANATPTTNSISAGDTPEGSAVAASVTLTDAAGNLLAGVPVVFTVSDATKASIVSTAVTVYSGSNGKAASSVFAWIAGTYTVTATAGGVTGTGSYTFANSTAADARVLSATAVDGILTAKVVDRFGNPVSGVTVYASRTSGTGYFGTGVSKTSTTTGVDGTAEFTLVGTADVKVSTLSYDAVTGTNAAGQTCALAGNLTCAVGTTAATAFTATTAGTTTVPAANYGSSFAPAGVSAVTVAVNNNAAADSAQAAADAAAEATDAANAATDAANAAAEAADAATAAAQDAADAVAALSTQVSEMIDALKKQITALTNLVIKIQKKVKA
jgi:hypothetical protein